MSSDSFATIKCKSHSNNDYDEFTATLRAVTSYLYCTIFRQVSVVLTLTLLSLSQVNETHLKNNVTKCTNLKFSTYFWKFYYDKTVFSSFFNLLPCAWSMLNNMLHVYQNNFKIWNGYDNIHLKKFISNSWHKFLPVKKYKMKIST